ncbi:hypothetical protein M0E87_00770 [Corynebacterium sp. CCM 9185]|uniref:Uncharacterized protein n=1 Tax=Corynebacterium marambiense TaxID=2765364 RepID=A0ABS0VY62_9CORY|nr:hypothetical protein [Corynebacterium marambiense]MBI9001739.1 hypothetical protein [Corynebacterium marambiense]MCK7662203.1 hypothetical protein [Corynebacterium marambiense]MCX7541473.1 hypothetical protein [Corynebacterium marambiense]
MNTPNPSQEGWNPGPHDPSAPAPGWNTGLNQVPSWDPAASGTDMEQTRQQEEARSTEQAELRQRGAARWIQISTALVASVVVVTVMVWGWQQLFWLQLLNDANNYIETADGKELVNEELIKILERSGRAADTAP